MQVLLYLAWALTVCKSQGLTMSRVQIDLGKEEFCVGSTFVVLLRVKDLGGLMILDSLDCDMSKILVVQFLMSAKQTLRPSSNSRQANDPNYQGSQLRGEVVLWNTRMFLEVLSEARTEYQSPTLQPAANPLPVSSGLMNHDELLFERVRGKHLQLNALTVGARTTGRGPAWHQFCS
ncbi:hypothetical protein K435DRAFT_960738 [Dendrothele bispora CBS 962.96]|uniref:Uncharacterized protein n=1 Tax=Dendrothele bispora (strain CBS 962.96) TaxID=1314807 RepID=A0A4S8MTD2_DENBC|nr:hypothetical protein K435DRAFT_960738 [Dendrothele bispora CBS 962.96]